MADARLAARWIAGRDASDADAAVAALLRDRFEAWPRAHTIDTAGDPADSVSAALGPLDV
jgi:predicted kinase